MAPACGKAKLVHLMTKFAEKERERARDGGPQLLQGHILNDLIPLTRPHLLKFPPPPNSNKSETKDLSQGPLGTVQIQTIATSSKVSNPFVPTYHSIPRLPFSSHAKAFAARKLSSPPQHLTLFRLTSDL
jgi:hypothetical protein